MSCYTVDKYCGFCPQRESKFEDNFLKNVIPVGVSRFREILVKKQLSKIQMKNSKKKIFRQVVLEKSLQIA